MHTGIRTTTTDRINAAGEGTGTTLGRGVNTGGALEAAGAEHAAPNSAWHPVSQYATPVPRAEAVLRFGFREICGHRKKDTLQVLAFRCELDVVVCCDRIV